MTSQRDLLMKIEALQDRIHAIFEESRVVSKNMPEDYWQSSWSPAVDVCETEREFILTAEIPGVEKNQIDLQIVNHVLHLRGERDASKDPPKQVYHRVERPSGTFDRRFELPEEVDQDGIKAELAGGVLTVFLPKRRKRPPTIKVEVNKNESQSGTRA
jgi:HSP20 family protein